MASRVLGGKSIMLVEDEFLIAEAMGEALKMESAHVLGPFADVKGALGALDSGQTVDAAVLDVNLKGERVYPLIDHLAARHIPIVLTTGYDSDAIPHPYTRLPCLQKPILLRQLLESLDQLLAG